MGEVKSVFQVLIFLGVNNLLTGLGLLILAKEDILQGEIHFHWLILLVDFRYYQGYIILIVFLLSYPLIKKQIGGADLLIIALLLTRYNLFQVNLIVLIASFSALIVIYFKKKSEVRFIPYLLLGFIIILGKGEL